MYWGIRGLIEVFYLNSDEFEEVGEPDNKILRVALKCTPNSSIKSLKKALKDLLELYAYSPEFEDYETVINARKACGATYSLGHQPVQKVLIERGL